MKAREALSLGAACATLSVATAIALIACTSSQAGLEGPPGPPGPAGEAGVLVLGDGGALLGDGPQVSVRAQQGLAISPVTLSISRMTLAQAEQIGQGSYLVNAVGSCSDCHTPSAPGPLEYLAGGTAYAVDNGAIVYARNLTPDSQTGLQLTQAQFITSMTTGKDFSDKSGQSILLVMAWSHFRWLTTADLEAIYAYLQAIPAVSNRVPVDTKAASQLNGPPASAPTEYNEGDVVRPLPPAVDANGQPVNDPDAVMRGLAILPLDAPTDAALQAMPPDQQAQLGRGSYLANAAQCNDCHTNPPRLNLTPGSANYLHVDTANYLTGGRVFVLPPALETSLHQVRTMSSDLTGAKNGYLQSPQDSFDRLLSILESGTVTYQTATGTGSRTLGWPMPWADFRNMTLDDLEALYAYLKALPPITGAADKATEFYARYCQTVADCRNGEQCSANECVGGACGAAVSSSSGADAAASSASSASACNVCQNCTGGVCAAPSASDPCLAGGI